MSCAAPRAFFPARRMLLRGFGLPLLIASGRELELGHRVNLHDRRNMRAQVLWSGMTAGGMRDVEEQRASDFDRDRRAIEMIGRPGKLAAEQGLEGVARLLDAVERRRVLRRERRDLHCHA